MIAKKKKQQQQEKMMIIWRGGGTYIHDICWCFFFLSKRETPNYAIKSSFTSLKKCYPEVMIN